MTPPAALTTALARLRRRSGAVIFAENAAVALPVALALAAPALAWMQPRALVALGLAAAAVTTALAGAAVVAFWRTPSLRRVAARADAVLRLDDRLVSAVQHVHDRDEVSGLLVADAAWRVADVPPAVVFPLTWPRRAQRVLAAAAVAGVAAAAVAARLSPADPGPSFDRAGSGAQAAAGADTDASASARNADKAAADASSQQQTVAVPAAGGAPRTASPGAAIPGERTQPERVVAARDAQGSGAAYAAAAAAPARPGQPLASGGTGASPNLAATSKAGGVGRGSRGREPAMRAPADPRPRAAGAEYAAARARAESAVTAGRIPPGLREYVKAYFIAIRP